MKNLTQLNQSARFNYGKYTYVPLYDFILSNMLTKYKNFGEAIKAYCFPKLFLGKAIANSLLAGAPSMARGILMLFYYVENFILFHTHKRMD